MTLFTCYRYCFTMFLFTGIVAFVAQVVSGQSEQFDMNSMKKNCPNFRCSGGYTPVPKSRTKFESLGGCASMGGGSMFTMDSGSSEKPYESCCHQWQACYQVCGVSKKSCDKSFEDCAKKSCSDMEGEDEVDQCTKDLQMANLMMSIGGCSKFDQAQYKSCECSTAEKAPEKREAAIRYFYKKHSPENVDKVESLVGKADTPSKFAGLFVKLLAKYPGAIAIKEDPMKRTYDNIMKERKEEKDGNEDNIDDNEESEEERIEL